MDNIHILPFKFQHLGLLKELDSLRPGELKIEIAMKNLPKVGYIAMLGKHPIAAGFMRRVEPNFAQLDTFITNPHFGSKARHTALSKIVDQLIDDAKDLKIVGLLAFTKDEGIFDRALQVGFGLVDQHILGKRL